MENAALALQAYALMELPWQPERIAAALQPRPCKRRELSVGWIGGRSTGRDGRSG